MRLRLTGKRLLEVFINFFDESGRREPFLIGADKKRQIFGHMAAFHRLDNRLLQRLSKFDKRIVAILRKVL